MIRMMIPIAIWKTIVAKPKNARKKVAKQSEEEWSYESDDDEDEDSESSDESEDIESESDFEETKPKRKTCKPKVTLSTL